MDGGLSLRKPPDSLKGRAYSLRPGTPKRRYSLRDRIHPRWKSATMQLSGTRIITSTGSVAPGRC